MLEGFTRKEIVATLQIGNTEINAIKYDLFGDRFDTPQGSEAVWAASLGIREMIRLRKEQTQLVKDWVGRLKR